ncbi:MAG: carboxypeptidase-like regulatory domain-containing protein, partial [Cyclobacteriaceae bacterium]|nr:carboxypeptidase-like regulatory domain-containing protein [Cyclobacteriaceae bacterium]
MEKFYKRLGLLALMLLSASFAFAQTTISGTVKDGITGEALPGVSILVKGKVIGTTTTVSGEFTLKVNQAPPLTLVVSSVGYKPQELEITDANTSGLAISLEEQSVLGQEVVVSASRVEENILKSPVTVEKMDLIAIQQSPTPDYFDALANVKGV